MYTVNRFFFYYTKIFSKLSYVLVSKYKEKCVFSLLERWTVVT